MLMQINLFYILFICLIFKTYNAQAKEAAESIARYDKYRIYKVQPTNTMKLMFIKELESSSDSIIILDAVNSLRPKPIHVLVAPHKFSDFIKYLQQKKIQYELMLENVQSFLDNNLDDTQIAPLHSKQYDWTKYYELDDTYEWLKYLANEYRNVVKLLNVGRSYENRTILGIKISKNNLSKPGIFIEAGIHAREWIASTTATFLINQLLISNEPSVRYITENYDWYVVPHANPDGYVYSHKTNRLWRKTRTPYGGGCFGADPNRNWSFQWNKIGASNKPCAETYAGPKAFSEIETRTMARFIKSLRKKIKLFISFHSFSQLILHPYGHTSQSADNYEDLKQVMNASVIAIRQRYGTRYSGGSTYNAIYPASGGSIDWVYAELGIKMAFLYELRPKRSDLFGIGFVLPAKSIIPTAEETLDSIMAMVKEVEKLGYFNNA